MEFGEHRVETHARETDLSMVYTIDPAVVDDYINSVEHLLARDKYKVAGIDLQYTIGRPDIDHKVAVAQLCVHHHVLIYHYCMATKPCARFKIENNMVDEKITAEQLIENYKVMTISRAMIMNIGIMSVISRPKRFCIHYYYPTHRLLSSMHLEY